MSHGGLTAFTPFLHFSWFHWLISISQCREEELIIEITCRRSWVSPQFFVGCFYCSQIMTWAVTGVFVSQQTRWLYWSMSECLLHAESQTQVARKWVLEWRSDGLLKGLSLCATTNIRAGLCWIFNACQVCVEMGRTALLDSLWDTLAVGFAGRGLSQSEGSVWTVRCQGAIMSQQRSFSFQNKCSQTRIASNCSHAITSSTFIRVKWMWGKYIDVYGCYHIHTCSISRWRSATNSDLHTWPDTR